MVRAASPIPFACGTLLILVTCAAASAQSQIEQQRRSRQLEYKQKEEYFGRMPKLEKTQIDDVFQLRIKDGKTVICNTPGIDIDKVDARQYRLELDNFKGLTSVNIIQSRRQLPAVRPGGPPGPIQLIRIFNFTYDRMEENGALTTLSLQRMPGSIQLSRSSRFDNGQMTVRLMQQAPDDQPGTGVVQLWVIRSTFDGSQEPLSVSATEADFSTLLSKHPDEVNKYLRPMLRELAQEQVLAPDWRVAWQVLSDHWPPQEAARQQVKALLPGLGDFEFRKRERALAELMKLDVAGIAVLRKLERAGLSPEQNRAVDVALAPFTQLSEREAERLAKDKGFLLDCLFINDAPVREAAFQQLRAITSRNDLKYDADASNADRFATVRALRRELLKEGE
jgi:hypothetical protein